MLQLIGTSCLCYNNNCEQYIILEISSKIYCMNKREFTSSESNYYMVRTGKGLTTSLSLRTKIPNKNKKSRFAITDITKQYFSKFLNNFDRSHYLDYNIKQVNNKQTEACFFLIKNINKEIKSKWNVQLCTKVVKSGVNRTIGHIKEIIGHVKESIQCQ